MKDKFLQFLGLAQRAGALQGGEYACLRTIRSGRGYLLILAEDVSTNTRDRLEGAAKGRSMPVLIIGSKGELGHAVGQSQRAALVVTEARFAKRLRELGGRE